MMKNIFCVNIFFHLFVNSVYHVCLLRAHFLCQVFAFQLFFLLQCVLLPDFGPSFTDTIRWVAECFVELLAFCKVLVFRNTCYGRVAIVQEVCCAEYHSSRTLLLMFGKSSKSAENCKLAQLLEAVFFSFPCCYCATKCLFCVQLHEGCKVKEPDFTVVVVAVNRVLTVGYKYLSRKYFLIITGPMESITRKSSN